MKQIALSIICGLGVGLALVPFIWAFGGWGLLVALVAAIVWLARK
jgi:hypothetical protein